MCQEFGVRCISTFDLLSELKPQFVLE
ncbi:DUF4411 family protein [Nitrincola sp. A-D6]|nr:DUF4411 family protein [Nitrincola sp. A-D6]